MRKTPILFFVYELSSMEKLKNKVYFIIDDGFKFV